MSDNQETGTLADAEAMSRLMGDFAERSQRIVQSFCDRQTADGGFQVADPVIIGKAFMDMTAKLMADPQKLAEAQAELW